MKSQHWESIICVLEQMQATSKSGLNSFILDQKYRLIVVQKMHAHSAKKMKFVTQLGDFNHFNPPLHPSNNSAHTAIGEQHPWEKAAWHNLLALLSRCDIGEKALPACLLGFHEGVYFGIRLSWASWANVMKVLPLQKNGIYFHTTLFRNWAQFNPKILRIWCVLWQCKVVIGAVRIDAILLYVYVCALWELICIPYHKHTSHVIIN